MTAARSLWHEAPDLLEFEAGVLDTRPGMVLLSRSAFYPGGGGQPADRGVLRWAGGEVRVERLETEGGALWHVLAEPVVVEGSVLGVVDAAFRQRMCQLHTDLHIVNALAFRAFDGALVTGAQIGDDGTARIDLDLPGADNDRVRALEPAINDAIRQDLAVGQVYVPADRGRARARAPAEPLGQSPAPGRRDDPGDRDRGTRPPGVRRHAPLLDRPVAAGAHPQGRQQGAPQPADPDRPRRLTSQAPRRAPALRRPSLRRGARCTIGPPWHRPSTSRPTAAR